MLLNEFFGKAVDVGIKANKNNSKHSRTADDAFWYILDHDRLHKDFFHSIAPKIKKNHNEGRDDKEQMVKMFGHMVNKGCLEFYHKYKLQGPLGKLFPKEIREEMCERLYNHYREDIVKDSYRLGL
jgi:hypothetical protein